MQNHQKNPSKPTLPLLSVPLQRDRGYFGRVTKFSLGAGEGGHKIEGQTILWLKGLLPKGVLWKRATPTGFEELMLEIFGPARFRPSLKQPPLRTSPDPDLIWSRF